jgi:hypothetical protein
MIEVKVCNKANTTLTQWKSETAPFVKGDVIHLDSDKENPRVMVIIERQWHAVDQLVLITTVAAPDRHAAS